MRDGERENGDKVQEREKMSEIKIDRGRERGTDKETNATRSVLSSLGMGVQQTELIKKQLTFPKHRRTTRGETQLTALSTAINNGRDERKTPQKKKPGGGEEERRKWKIQD
ncbi:uncharacterized [Tachysurus ichikawai]